MVVTVSAFFLLVLDDVGTYEHWVWFLVSACGWVPGMWIDFNTFGEPMVSALAVWSTALATIFIFQDALQEEPRDTVHVGAAAWLMAHHVILDGVVWLQTDGN